MRLRAFVSDCLDGFCVFVERHDLLYRLFEMFGSSVVLPSGDIETRERLVQTYLIVFGLFLSYDRDVALQSTLMSSFIWFLWASLIYYSLLIRPFHRFSRLLYNFLAVMMACLFSYAFMSCVIAFGNGNVNGIWVMFCVTAFVVAYPLFV